MTSADAVLREPRRPRAPAGADSAREERRAAGGVLIRRPTFVVSALIVLAWILAAIGWRWLGIDPYADTGASLAAPSADHWFGTDRIGRDVFARVLAGSESVLVVAPAATLVATVLGTVVGLVAGYRRGWIDAALMRVLDVLIVVPVVVVLLVVVTAFGQSLPVLILAIGVLLSPLIARVVRAQTLMETGKEYIESARLQGERPSRMLLHELLPNVWPQALVQATLCVGIAVFVTATLSFLGLAATPPSPDWGLAVSENRAFLQGAWWTVAFPCAAIASLVVSVNLIGDNVKEVLAP
ncbi:ABC transporter permease [Microbacterium awajiense]|uniref:ABC transporter permease n=1 Tax=Microbacterium awajiense TaxID=415214 RepID=A0ABP7AV97_9MICO